MSTKFMFFCLGVVAGLISGILLVGRPLLMGTSPEKRAGVDLRPLESAPAAPVEGKAAIRKQEVKDLVTDIGGILESRKTELGQFLRSADMFQLREPKLIELVVLHGLQTEFIDAMHRNNDPAPGMMFAAEWHLRHPWSFDLKAFGEGEFKRRAVIGLAASQAGTDPEQALQILKENEPPPASATSAAVAVEYAFVFGDLPARAATEIQSRWLLKQDPANPKWSKAYSRLLYGLAQAEPSEVKLFVQGVSDPQVRESLARSSASGAIRAGHFEEALPLIRMAAPSDQADLKDMLEARRRELATRAP